MDGKAVYSGVASLSAVGVETTIASIPSMDDDYIVTGWVDLSAMRSGARVTLCIEFYVVEGQQQPSRLCAEYRAPGDAAPVHIKPMYMPKWARVTFKATLESGQPIDVPFWIVVVKPDIGVKQWLMRRFA